MSREIKFRIIRGNRIVGYERINTDGNWEWRVPELDSDVGERWIPGVIQDTYRTHDYTRDQMTGLKDKHGVDIYEGDIVHYDLRDGLGLPRINGRKIEVKYYPTGYFSEYYENIIVLGNIYEHKHLLS